MDHSENHFHWIILAAETKVENGFADSTTVDVIAEDLPSALIKARKLVPDKRFYYLSSVLEHEPHNLSRS